MSRLAPAERVAFVLHDMFAVPFEEIAPIVDRSTVTTKKLASRARSKVHGRGAVTTIELRRQRHVVERFLAASRAGDLDAVLALLAPNVVRRADRVAVPADRALEVRGASTVAEEISRFGRAAGDAEPVLIDGAVGIAVAPLGRLALAIVVTSAGERIIEYELIAAPDRLGRLDIRLLDAVS